MNLIKAVKGNENSRYEIKMIFDGLRIDEVRSWVYSHIDSFRDAFPLRQVNNIYFDNYTGTMFSNHINGIVNRAKVRFRWYGKLWVTSSGQIEIKVKNNKLGYKTVKLIPDKLDLKGQRWSEIMAIFNSRNAFDFSSQFGILSPVLINQYVREYYISADSQIRLTLDYKLKSFNQSFGFFPNTNYENPALNSLIIELKASREYYKRLSNTVAGFPLYATQNSKYLLGVENI